MSGHPGRKKDRERPVLSLSFFWSNGEPVLDISIVSQSFQNTTKHDIIALLWQPPFNWKEVSQLELLISLIVSIAAEVIAYYLCKWLDEDK